MPATFNYNANAQTFDYEGFRTITGLTASGTTFIQTGTRSSTGATGNSGDTNVLSATTWTTIQTNYINAGTAYRDLPTTIGMDKNVLRTAFLLGYLRKYKSFDQNVKPKVHRGRSGG